MVILRQSDREMLLHNCLGPAAAERPGWLLLVLANSALGFSKERMSRGLSRQLLNEDWTSADALEAIKLRAGRQRQRIAPELVMPHPLPDLPSSPFQRYLSGNSTTFNFGNSRQPPLNHSLPLVLSGHIITGWSDFGPTAWALPTWQQLSCP